MIQRLALHRVSSTILLALLLLAATGLFMPRPLHAVPLLVQTNNDVTNGGTSASANLTTPATANNLLIVVCGARTATSITGPAGFTMAKNETGTPAQVIYYKVAVGGEQALNCTVGANTRLGMQTYEYSGMATSSPLDAVNTLPSTGTSTSPASGTVITTNANDLIISAITTNASTSVSSWNNSFILRNNFTNGGAKSSQATYSGADRTVSAIGTYSSTATAGVSGAWRGQIAAFKAIPPALDADIVDASGNSVLVPTAFMSSATYAFACQTATGTLGTSNQKIRVRNTTANPAWVLSIAATNGSSSKWSFGPWGYNYNNPSGSGCSAGQLTVNPGTATATPQTGCSNTGLTLGGSATFSAGVTDSITLATTSTSANINCYWDLTGIALSQKIPAEQTVGAYLLNLTVTIVAN